MSANHRLTLVPHPSATPPTGVSVTVDLLDHGVYGLDLHYRISDPERVIRYPEPVLPGPADGLWRHTCCEAFVADPANQGYTEFNFSPSGHWAVYTFDDYRLRATHQGRPAWPPSIRFEEGGDDQVMSVRVHGLLLPLGDRLVSVAGVLETLAGKLSWWALRHPLDIPDFHHRDGFALLLPKDSAA